MKSEIKKSLNDEIKPMRLCEHSDKSYIFKSKSILKY
jgi:hypothetical protein